jgi:mRNA degradation ribonuclease J1/J2
MSMQQVVHIIVSMPLYHSTRLFQFINTCQQQDRAFVLLPQKI